jgi:hypothetical protein
MGFARDEHVPRLGSTLDSCSFVYRRGNVIVTDGIGDTCVKSNANLQWSKRRVDRIGVKLILNPKRTENSFFSIRESEEVAIPRRLHLVTASFLKASKDHFVMRLFDIRAKLRITACSSVTLHQAFQPGGVYDVGKHYRNDPAGG